MVDQASKCGRRSIPACLVPSSSWASLVVWIPVVVFPALGWSSSSTASPLSWKFDLYEAWLLTSLYLISSCDFLVTAPGSWLDCGFTVFVFPASESSVDVYLDLSQDWAQKKERKKKNGLMQKVSLGSKGHCWWGKRRGDKFMFQSFKRCQPSDRIKLKHLLH